MVVNGQTTETTDLREVGPTAGIPTIMDPFIVLQRLTCVFQDQAVQGAVAFMNDYLAQVTSTSAAENIRSLR